MSNGDAVLADDDLLDEQSDDALAFQHVQILGFVAQALEEFAQRVGQPQVGGLIGQLAPSDSSSAFSRVSRWRSSGMRRRSSSRLSRSS